MWQFEHSLALPFFRIGMKTELFQSCSHSWVFQIYWQIECSTLTASSFRILNNTYLIPSPPLALFIVILPKAHLISGCLALGEWSHIVVTRVIKSWSTKWNRANVNRVLSKEQTGHRKHSLAIIQETILHMNITRWSILKSDWLYYL